MDLSDNKTINWRADYEKLYHAAFNYLTDIYNMAFKAQQELDEMYLNQTEPIAAPDYLKLADADGENEIPTQQNGRQS